MKRKLLNLRNMNNEIKENKKVEQLFKHEISRVR